MVLLRACFFRTAKNSRVPNTTGVPNKHVGDFFCCLLGEKKNIGGKNFLKRIRFPSVLFETLEKASTAS